MYADFLLCSDNKNYVEDGILYTMCKKRAHTYLVHKCVPSHTALKQNWTLNIQYSAVYTLSKHMVNVCPPLIFQDLRRKVSEVLTALGLRQRACQLVLR